MTLLGDATGPIDLLDPARVSARAAAVPARESLDIIVSIVIPTSTT